MSLVVSLLVLVLAASWRIAAVHAPALSNFAPLMALTFCGAVYLRDKRLWLVPFAALLISDLYLDHYHATTFGETWTWPSVALRAVCFGIALPIGSWVAQRKSWLAVFGGALAGSLFFYLVTNTDAWVRDPYYAKTLTGWVQSLTVGRPEFPPTIWFFRNTLASDLIFTATFAGAMEFAALRSGAASLFAKRAIA